MTAYKKAPFSIKRAYTVAEVADEMGGPDECYIHNFNGVDLVAPWWAETAVVDHKHMLRVFPGVPHRKVEEDGKWEWRSTDCNDFQSRGLIIGEMEVNEKPGYTAFAGVLITLCLLPFKDIEE